MTGWIPALVTPEWLEANLATANVAVFDASFFLPAQNRDAATEYRLGHIPGAMFFDIDEVSDHSTNLAHMLPSADQFANAVGALGISQDTHVIAYDSNFFMAAARLWWTFRVFGHDHVSVLDGGLERWKAEGRPMSTDPAKPSPQVFRASYRPDLVASLAEVRGWMESDQRQILDARSPGRFQGREPEPRPGLRSGHIPGSRNVFFKALVDEESRSLKSASELAGLFEAAGIDAKGSIVTSCGTGVTAAVLALGLYCLGNDQVKVYDGSWTEWGNRPDTLVATS